MNCSMKLKQLETTALIVYAVFKFKLKYLEANGTFPRIIKS